MIKQPITSLELHNIAFEILLRLSGKGLSWGEIAMVLGEAQAINVSSQVRDMIKKQ